MSFRENVDKHIEEMLCEGVLPDSDEILEMEVPGQQAGPQRSGPEGGPVSARAAEATFTDQTAPPNFGSASKGGEFHTDPPSFSQQNAAIAPAKFGSAAKIKETAEGDEVVAAVLADLQALNDSE